MRLRDADGPSGTSEVAELLTSLSATLTTGAGRAGPPGRRGPAAGCGPRQSYLVEEGLIGA
jgi:hypothetical protein